MEKLANFLYGWLIDDFASYVNFFKQHQDPRGLNICLFIMLAVAIGAAAIYYFAIASKVNSATKSNYLWTCIFGYVVLALFTPLIFQLIFRNDGCVVLSFWIVFAKIAAMNIFYYLVVYQIASSLFCQCPCTAAKNITLLTVFK